MYCNRKRHSIKYVKEKTKEIAEGYKCLEENYINNRTKLKFKCKEGHIFFMKWAQFQRGCRCPKCSKYCNRYTIEDIKEKTKEIAEGYKCISDKYKNTKNKLTFLCDKNHIFEMGWNDFKKGHRCPICKKIKQKKEGNPFWKGGVVEKNIALFDTYASQLDFCEEVRRDSENTDYLQVKCTESNCEKWFRPTRVQVVSRICSLNKLVDGENRFYCSDKCKNSCSIFGQHMYPKGFINTDNIRYDQTEWASMVKERDNFECQRCGNKKKLVAHHIEGLNENPLMSADIDIGITLCKKCHKKAHKEIGCRFVDMRKENICNELH
uniref:Putative HNH endonuclease n=1 Tax=viral metagenome TaxID=1070528 RepID=A0A6M3XQ86_9ZZZZ